MPGPVPSREGITTSTYLLTYLLTYISRSYEPVAEICPFEIFQDGGGRHTGFLGTGNSAIRSAVPEMPTLEPNMKCIACGDMAIRVYWGHMEPHLGGRGGRRGSSMTPFERATVVSYRLSIVIFALSVTIRPQFIIECLRRSNQHGWVTLGPNFSVFPIGIDHWCLGPQRANIPG